MNLFKVIVFSLLLSFFLINKVNAAPSMAFGYLSNESSDMNYEYLETIFPNSFANSLKNIFDVNVVKPHQVNKKLEKFQIKLKKYYNTYEIPELMDKVDTDYFIFGKFVPMPGNKIFIVLNLYEHETNRVFTFSNTGKMESEIFKLVDRITQIMINHLDVESLYMTGTVAKGSKLGIITNIGGVDLNQLYHTFLKNRFKIIGIHGNSLFNNNTVEMIDSFTYIYTENNSYDIITDHRKVKFLYGPWASKNYIEKVSTIKKIFKKYDLNYSKTKSSILEKISKVYNNNIDNLLIIGFNKKRTRAWVRCFDLKNKNLIWMQSNISALTIPKIVDKMVARMTKRIKQPFEKKF